MNLIPKEDVPDQPGLWVNPAWKPGMPGTFAVVIGVSSYRHLEGGAAPTPHNGVTWISEVSRFGQLHVSSLTANRIFCWLAGQYRFDDAPLARCWLLLAPTPDEIPLLSFGGQKAHFAEPTFSNCERAISWWHDAMSRQPKPAAPDSRGVFFFSGHGLEVRLNQQLLLPADYLGMPAPNINKAIATNNLLGGTASLPLNRQIFFIDACRNDHSSMRGKAVTGTNILVEDESAIANPDLANPILYATAPGLRAWEHRDPNKGISIFGQALLDGLAGRPSIELQCDATRCEVQLYPLQGYLKARVAELMRNAGSTDRQVVRLGGTPDATTITWLDPRATSKGVSRGAAPAPAARPGPFVPEAAAAVPISEKPSDSSGALWSTDWGEGHKLFGSEIITEMWQKRSRVWQMSGRRWLDLTPLRIARVNRDLKRTSFIVRFTIDDFDPAGHLFEITDARGVAHACALPHDPSRPVFELEFDRASEQSDAPITRLEVSLAPQDGVIGLAAKLWRKYSAEGLGAALREDVDFKLLLALLEKEDSPIAATVAALVLLRGNRVQQLLRLSEQDSPGAVPEMIDVLVITIEALRRLPTKLVNATLKHHGDSLISALFAKLNTGGIPGTGESFEYAVELVGRYAATNKGSSSAEHLDGLLDRVAKHYRPGGLFLSLSGLERGVAPSLFALDAALTA